MSKKVLCFLFLIAVTSSVFGQQPANQPPANQPAGDKPKDPLDKIALEDFEESEDWRAKSTTPLGETKTLKMIQRGTMKDVFDEKTVPDALANESEQEKQEQRTRINKNHILGIKTFFVNRGFDRVEVAPPHEYIIKGKARQVSVWVLGRKYRHTLYAKFRDYRGVTHNVRLGRLDFFGWRKLTATIPGYLPQSTRFALLDKNLHFVSLFVTSDVHEIGGNFYFYLDDLEVRADKSDARYPGYEIKDNW
ncbi:MAG: flagellar filament outer layer protein FlaA [Leptospiraceae bacterium]|nr:endoflagellar filament sheath protein [Leptospiraceae bacterium]MCK6381809.1 flagellar filament outer layer protein FlaA [Leptospiraceae bacterium]NUM42970.1 endoflagellar filament sheath protein [Leptospiraceae bacterium]